MRYTMTFDDYLHDIRSIIVKKFDGDKEADILVLHALVETVNDLYSDALREIAEERGYE